LARARVSAKKIPTTSDRAGYEERPRTRKGRGTWRTISLGGVNCGFGGLDKVVRPRRKVGAVGGSMSTIWDKKFEGFVLEAAPAGG